MTIGFIMKRTLALLLLSTSLLATPALAQNDPATMDRVDRLERDIMLLQRQLARGQTPAQPAAAPLTDADLPPEGAAQLEVRLSTMEEQLRKLNGKVEENDFQVRKLTETLERLQKDTEFRFSELAKSPPPAGEDGAKPPEETPKAGGKKEEEKPVGKLEKKPLPGNPEIAGDNHTTAGDGALKLPDTTAGEDSSNFATPRDHYNYAFRLLNQTKYNEAAKAFESFTKKYPKDPLVGNAYYWQGETFYIRRDYVAAADHFRQGFEALPTGPKAADNLLKLAMSLNALGRDKEACVVLGQVTTKFKKSAASVADKADQEKKRIGCS